MKTTTQPQIAPGAEIEDQMRSAAGDLLTEKLVPEDLQGKVEVVVNPDGTLSISRCYLEDPEFEKYLEWVRSSPEINESVRWDDAIFPGEYRVPKGTLTEMVRSTEPYRKRHQLPKSQILSHAVEIYYRLRGEPRSEEFCSFIGRALARTNHPDLEETCERLKENIREAVGQTLESRPDRSDTVEVILDGTWKKILNLLRNYNIADAILEGNGETLTLSGHESSVQVRAELQGPVAGNSELEKLEVNVETLSRTLKIFGTSCRVEVRAEDKEIKVLSPDPSRCELDLPAEKTLPVGKPSREEPQNLDIDYSVEAESVDIWTPLRAAEKIHGTDGFQATITTGNGRLLFEYWTENSAEGLRSDLGEVEVDADASSTYRPELLKPLKGEWNLRMGAGLPLRAEKVFGKGEKDRKANVTVILTPRVENTK